MFDGQPTVSDTNGVYPGNTPSRPNGDELKRVWYIEQIYDPDVHPVGDMSKYIVPYEGEIVIDRAAHKFYEVSHVDRYGTWKSTFVPWYPIPETNENDYSLFPKHEYGFLQGELALCIDYSVRPPVARVDANAMAPDAAYALLYEGSVIGEAGKIISARYSGSDLVDNHISVSPVVIDNLENKTIMGADSFSVQLNEAAMPNGKRCTLVYYDVAGRPIPPTYSVAVQHSAYLKDHQLGQRYVKSIELVSPWFTNSTLPNTLFIPINLALKAVEFRAKVHYSDGSYEEHPVNSFNGESGFTLSGLEQYKPTTPGQSTNALVLSYAYKNNEQAYIAQPGSPKHTSNRYTIVATTAQGSYSPRIYSYPYWDPAAGWKLRHWLTDLDRRYCRDVTQLVTLNEASPAFDGRKYGEEQNLIFNLNMRDVSASYEPWSFVQHTTITLYSDGTVDGRKWDVRHSYGKPAFSAMSVEYIEQVGGTQIAKFAGMTSLEDFLNKAYYGFDPIYDPRTESKALVPTHFDLVKNNNTARTGIPIAEFNNIPVGDLSFSNGEGVYLRWTRREMSGNELQLGVSAGVCKKVVVYS